MMKLAATPPKNSDLGRLLTLVGGRDVRAWHELDRIHEVTQKGVPAQSVKRLEAFLKLDIAQTARIVGISSSTRKRYLRTPQKLLKPEVSDRVLRTVWVIAEALEVLGDEEKVRHWLTTPSQALDDQEPRELLATFSGVQLLHEELNRIKHGMWA